MTEGPAILAVRLTKRFGLPWFQWWQADVPLRLSWLSFVGGRITVTLRSGDKRMFLVERWR